MSTEIIHKTCWKLAVLDPSPYGYEVEGYALFYLAMKDSTVATMAEIAEGLEEGYGYAYRTAQRAMTELVRKGLAIRLKHGVYQANFNRIFERALQLLEEEKQ